MATSTQELYFPSPPLNLAYSYGIPTGTKLHGCISLCYSGKLYKSVVVCIIFHCAVHVHICPGVTVGSILWGKGVHVVM